MHKYVDMEKADDVVAVVVDMEMRLTILELGFAPIEEVFVP